MFTKSKKNDPDFSIRPIVVNNYTLSVSLDSLRKSEKATQQFEKAKERAKELAKKSA